MQEVDFATCDITVTKSRADVVDFMTPFWEEHVAFMIRVPKENKLITYVNPFRVSMSIFLKP